MKHRIVFLDRNTLPVRFTTPRCAGEYVEYPETRPDEAEERLAGATVAITNKVPIRAPALSRLPDLKLIAMAATGHDCVDTAYCREHGITVVNIRRYATHSVPEHVFALLLALRRNLRAYDAAVAAGAWQRANQFCFFDGTIGDLHGSTLGLVGRGSIGDAVARIAEGFGMRVIHYRRAPADGEAGYRPLPQLLAEADVVSLHCPLTPDTRGLIGAAELRTMKAGAILINTARGGLVDEAALVAALRDGRIGGAGIDVLAEEPPHNGSPLLGTGLANLIVTPHVAWASTSAMETLADQLTGNIDAWAEGTPRNVVC